MSMDELEEIRKRKLEELQRVQQKQIEEELQLQQQIKQLENIVKGVMTKEALERYGNVKTVHPDKAVQVLAVLGQLLQTGKINKIDDEILKEILIKLIPKKKDFKIKRK